MRTTAMSIDTVIREDEPSRALKVMTTASTPATPGPSTPTAARPLPQNHMDNTEDKANILPPERPSSTPFPQQDLPESVLQSLRNVEPSGPYDPSRCIGIQGPLAYYPFPYCPFPNHPLPSHPLPNHPLPNHPLANYPFANHPLANYPFPNHPLANYPFANYPPASYPLANYLPPNYPPPNYPLGNYPLGDYPLASYPRAEGSSPHAFTAPAAPTAPASTSALCNLPVEIHDCILDHLFGVRLSASAAMRASSAGRSKALRGWSTALRHSRRRDVSELSLVTEKWRQLIQERLYRHIKIKATRESVEQAMRWFETNPHLCRYVKHIEFWFPVFQQRSPATRTLRVLSTTSPSNPLITPSQNGEPADTLAYQSPNNNCTLEEVFGFVRFALPEVCVLSLEGGERKKPPMVRQFRDPSSKFIPVLEKVTTLVCKGQWNLIRTDEDFQNIAAALPNLTEWHGSYAKGESKSYLCMGIILPKLPQYLTNLNLCLESDFRREAVAPSFWGKVCLTTHFCVDMAKAMPALEHFAYTGRVCRSFFATAASSSDPRTTRLKTVDIIVKNICRTTPQWNNGSGIMDMSFILSFEELVLSAIQSLGRLTAMELLQIKFIDLDSVMPSMNPFFQLKNNKCTGIWSIEIIEALAKARPSASFPDMRDGFEEEILSNGGQLLQSPLTKPRSDCIKVSSYLALSGGITIT